VIKLGLTGSIGMGKSTTAAMFRELGAAVHDSDAAVAALYTPGGSAVASVLSEFPDARGSDGGVDRGTLSRIIARDPAALVRLETIIHPLVRESRDSFLEECREAGKALVVFDVPLLFETGGDKGVDKIAVVSAPVEVQAARVMARPGMTADKFATILARQISDTETRARADFVINTGAGLEAARQQVEAIVAQLAEAAERRH